MSKPTKKSKKLRTSGDFSAITTVGAFSTTFDTAKLFDVSYTETGDSPVDQFIKNANALNLIYLKIKPPIDPVLASLVFLGYISVFESYIRALIRGVIYIDEYAQRLVEKKSVSFGAAVHHSPKLLPEALLEEKSLAASNNIKTTLENYIGVKLQSSDIIKPLAEFNKLCHLRHCCIHRFGKLGTNNAIELGLPTHKHLLEKPVIFKIEDIDNVVDTLRTLVKVINNETFKHILNRSVIYNKDNIDKNIKFKDYAGPFYSLSWSWVYKKDKKRFTKYYKLFATKEDSIPSPSASELYRRFSATMKLPFKPIDAA